MSGKKKELVFDAENHIYTVGDKKLTSVTTYLHKFFPEFDAEKKAREMAIKSLKTELIKLGFDVSGEEYEVKSEELITEATKEILASWKALADEGTTIHLELENYIKSGLKPISAKARSGRFWCHNNNWDDNLEAEKRIFSEELGLAGTIDLIIHHPDGTVSLCDWKTNKRIYKACFGRGGSHKLTAHLADCNYNHYNLQLSLYAYILEKEYGVKVKNLYLVHLKDGEYVEYRMDFLRNMIEEMVKDE